MQPDKEIIQRIEELEKKYHLMGQDLKSYLDGLLLSNYTTYWDYVRLDTLLTLQKPNTDFPDELVFIIYHQVTELYFRLAIHELEQVCHNGREVLPTGEDKGWKKKLAPEFFLTRVNRVNRYFEALAKSFDIMVEGMEKEQFLKFRMVLLPGSGFQSAQYRKIEIMCTEMVHLVEKSERGRFSGIPTDSSVEEMFKHLYWKKGATELATGKKTLTLKQFEQKYSRELTELGKNYKDKNLWAKYKELDKAAREKPELISALRQLDVNVNVNWPLVHYKSAVRYLQQDPSDRAATGGTNWQQYLPPRFQKRIFYPALWSDKEKEEWGKAWVESVVPKAHAG